MDSEGKLYADIQRILKRERSAPGSYDGVRAAERAGELFEAYHTDVRDLARGIVRYWIDTYIGPSAHPENEPDGEHTDWLVNASAFLSGTLAPGQNFSREDWRELREIVNCEAETLPMDMLSSMMSTMVERNVI